MKKLLLFINLLLISSACLVDAAPSKKTKPKLKQKNTLPVNEQQALLIGFMVDKISNILQTYQHDTDDTDNEKLSTAMVEMYSGFAQLTEQQDLFNPKACIYMCIPIFKHSSVKEKLAALPIDQQEQFLQAFFSLLYKVATEDIGAFINNAYSYAVSPEQPKQT